MLLEVRWATESSNQTRRTADDWQSVTQTGI